MTQSSNNIECPNCGYKIDVNDTLRHQVDEDLKKQYAAELAKKEASYKAQLQDFNKIKADVARLEREKEEQKAAIEAESELRFNEKLKTEQAALRSKLTKEMQDELSGQLSALQQEITDKSAQLQEFNKVKADFARLEREKEEQKAAIEAESELRFNEKLKTEQAALRSKLTKEMQDELTGQLNALQQEITDKSAQLQEFNKVKADVARLEREKEEQKAAIEAESELRFNEKLKTEQAALRSKLTKEMQDELSGQLIALQQEITDKSTQLQEFNKVKADVARLEREKEEQKAAIESELALHFNQKLKIEQTALRNKVTQELQNELSGQLNSLQQEITEKSNQLKEFNKAKSDIERLKREKDELRDQVVLEKEQEFSEKLKDEKLKLQKQIDATSNLKVGELQMQLEEEKLHREAQNKLIEEMKRKAEQGSMQIQGEVQELAVEEWLQDNFPLDAITEVKKGARGADCLQIVHTRNRQNCGTIYYESKRTKDFQAGWIEKFKNDIRDKNATLGVLVTEAMPNNMERMGLKDGVWICTFDEFKGLCVVLRDFVIKLSEAKLSQENKGDKMEMLYSYLTSNEFRLQVEGIVEGFTQMQSDIDTEKRAMTKIWKQREKQLEKVLLNTTNMHGSIRGIAGSAIQTVALLELSSDESLPT